MLLLPALFLICASPFSPGWAASGIHHLGLFQPDPNHIWNRVHRCLFLRQGQNRADYGEDTLDPLLWNETNHLLTGDSHQRALDCLDEFLRSHAEDQVREPVERAIFERDLWAVFDWTARSSGHQPARRALQLRLAEVLRRVALTAEQIRALPDTYDLAVRSGKFAATYDPASPQRAFLPPELFSPRGPWVCLASRGGDPVAIQHVGEFSGRSRFLVFLRLPGGRKATLEYLHNLWTFPGSLAVRSDRGFEQLNPLTPQFPPGTQVALVRQVILFDREGKLASTPLTEDVQLRVYRTITPGSQAINFINGPAMKDQEVFEFRLHRHELFHGEAGGLVAVAPEETEFPVFRTHGEDAFELTARQNFEHWERFRPVIMKSCMSCHADAGIHSVQSRVRLIKPTVDQLEIEALGAAYGALYWETEGVLAWKENRYDWGLLNGYWQAAAGP